MNIGKAIKELREMQDMSQAELARKSKLTQANLCNIELGAIFNPRKDTLKKLSAALKVPEPIIALLAIEPGKDPKRGRAPLYKVLRAILIAYIPALGNYSAEEYRDLRDSLMATMDEMKKQRDKVKGRKKRNK